MKPFYWTTRFLFKLLFSVFYKHKVYGTENLPEESVRISIRIAFWLFFRILATDASSLLSRVYELASMTNLQKNSSKIDFG